ncbi:MAG: LPS-assembly protein LptD [Acidobacteria bacterium]|nr:MAG: LPS-assembly protein LptD [Acidobacteriota bacterium]
MSTTHGRKAGAWRRLGGILLAAGLLAAPASAEEALRASGGIPGVKNVAFDRFTDSPEATRFEGNVDIELDGGRLIADEVVYDKREGLLTAAGSVVLSFEGAVLAGSRLTYRLADGTGSIEDVVGYLEEDQAILRAKRVDRVGPRRLRVERAEFTTCTQPTPYWSFRVARGTFDLGRYAYLHGVAFRASKLPLFYTPYLVWPIKSERASGLLFPEFHSSDKLGESVSLPVYWAFADNADVTFYLDYHTKVGPAIGAELVWLPTWNGKAEGYAYWINDRVRRKTRYRVDWHQRQLLPLDFKLTADIEQISDFDYTIDYETDLDRAGIPETRSTIDLTRLWSWYSLSVRAEQHEQFFVAGSPGLRLIGEKVINTQLPEIELRSRSRRLGRSPVHFAFVSSITGFRKQFFGDPAAPVAREEDLAPRGDNAWARADFAPRLEVPLVRSPWLDLQVDAAWRGTWYSARRDPADPRGIDREPLFRSLWSAGITVSGPRLQRVFDTAGWEFTPRLKHVIEPFLRYEWRPEAGSAAADVLVVDEVDAVPGQLSQVAYGIRQRLYALRPASGGRPVSLATAPGNSFDDLDRVRQEAEEREEESRASDPGAAVAVAENLNPAEILSVELSQSYSFVGDLSFRRACTSFAGGRCVASRVVGSRPYSPVSLRLRFNPTPAQSVDAAYVVDPLNRALTETSISAMLQFPRGGFFRGSWYRSRPPDPASASGRDFLRTSWGIARGRRLRFESDLDYDLETNQLDHQFYRISYNTQCCSVRLGYDRRDFAANARQEYTLVINLSGLGDVIDVKKTSKP